MGGLEEVGLQPQLNLVLDYVPEILHCALLPFHPWKNLGRGPLSSFLVSLIRALLYMIAQCLGAICGVGLVKDFQSAYYVSYGRGANELSSGYSDGTGLAVEIIGTFVLVYTVFSATDPKRNARDSHTPVLAPLPIGLVVFMVHLATIPITGTGINPARSLGAAVIYNKDSLG